MNQRCVITTNGKIALEQELHLLKFTERPKVITAIADARSNGDLSENADYDAAKEKQSFIESRICEIEAKLSIAEVIDVNQISSIDRVVFGLLITLFDETSEQEVVYRIVGDDEADIKLGKISISSPVAKAMLGKSVGDVFQVNTPSGQKSYEVVSIAR